VLSRGGIAVGELRHKGHFVYGSALIEAYQLESKSAHYPRIVLARDAVAKSLQVGGNPQGCEEFIQGFLRTDIDGFDHVHILDHKAAIPFHIMLSPEVQGVPGPISFKALIDAKVAAVNMALENNPAVDDHSRAKHEWLRRYTAQYELLYALVQNPAVTT
jgi:hypothetical protein